MNAMQETICDFLSGNGAFYGYFLQKLDITVDNTQPTLYIYSANSRLSMGYNKEYFESLSYKERMAVVEHEILHVANRHAERFNEARKHHQDKNTAYLAGTDVAINQLIDNMPKGSMNIGFIGKKLKEENIIVTDLEKNREAEYYIDLLKKLIEKKQDANKPGKLGKGCNHFDKSNEEKGLDEMSQSEVEEAIKECAKNSKWVEIARSQKKGRGSRMIAEEKALRFFAFNEHENEL